MEKMKQDGAREAKRKIDVLNIGPDSSPAEIELNERWSALPNEDLSRIVCDGFLCFLVKKVSIMIGEDFQEKQWCWWLEVLRRTFSIREYDPSRDSHRDFISCLKCLYICSLSGGAKSKFLFPKVNKKFWEEIMRDWHYQLCAEEWDQKILTFFLNRYSLALDEEKKVMSDIFRQRLTNARVEEVEGWVKWIFAPDKPEGWQFQPEISRHLAIARASAGGRNLMLENIRGGELLKALGKPESLPGHLFEAVCIAVKGIGELDQAACHFIQYLRDRVFKGAKEIEINYRISAPEQITIDIYLSDEIRRDMATKIREYVNRLYSPERRKGVLFSSQLYRMRAYLVIKIFASSDKTIEPIDLSWEKFHL